MPDRTGLQGFVEDARAWTRAVGTRVPSYVRLAEEVLALLEEPSGASVRAALAAAWAGRRFEASYDRPLLLFAALRADAIRSGPSHPLWEAIAAELPRAERVTRAAVAEALAPGRAETFTALERRTVQTNETSRAVAWLWPAHLMGADGGKRPLALVDLGASAGLNLVADRMPAVWTFADGSPVPLVHAPDVRLRLGLDRSPLNACDDGDVAWLTACIWTGESARLARLRTAVAAFRAASSLPDPPRLEAVEAEAMPECVARHTQDLPSGVLVIAYQSLMIGYLPRVTRDSYARGMRAWLAHSPNAIWVEVEQPAAAPRELPVVIRATFRGGGDDVHTVTMARCGYHPTALYPDLDGLRALRAASTSVSRVPP